MDAWLEDRHGPKVPEKSLPAEEFTRKLPAQADEAFGTYDYPRPERASALAARHAQTRFLLVPRAAYGIERTWDTVGMRGTGSDTLALDEVFVPIEHGRVRRRACRPP